MSEMSAISDKYNFNELYNKEPYYKPKTVIFI